MGEPEVQIVREQPINVTIDTVEISARIVKEQPINVAIAEPVPINVNILGKVGAKGEPLSVPPKGCFPIVNLYVNTAGKLVVAYNDIPAG